MIVSINTIHLPFAAELKFPQGLARGEVLTLLVGEGNVENFPKADDIRVDPLSKVVHIGLRPLEKRSEPQQEEDSVDQPRSHQLPQRDREEIPAEVGGKEEQAPALHQENPQPNSIDEPKEQEQDESCKTTQADSDDKIYCQICLKINRKLRFMNPHALETHMNNNHSVEVFEAPECRKCSKKFVSADALLNHEKKCNPKFPKKCQVCSKSFAMGLHRDRHLREVHGIIKEHSCGICGQKYQSEKHRDWHLVTKHKDSLSVDELEKLGMEEIFCTLCEFRSYSSKGMQVHRQKEHIENEKAFRCPACGVGNDSLAGIQEHINEKHGPDDRWWICQFCNRTFHRENADVIELHVEQHDRNTGVVCIHCNKVFETETAMLDHVNRNHDKNTMPYICDICDQGSESYKDLLKHMLKHNPFKTSLYRLQRQHIVKRNIEEGIMFKKETRQQTDQVYGCDVCNKQFDLEATLMAHRIVFHNDPGKEFYRCPVCNKAFKPHHLSYHLRLHSGERPHKCQYCEATFHTVASCSDHEIVKHTFAFKQRCPLCNKGFVSRAKTWQHIVRFHKESPEAADKILPPVTHKVLSILQKRRQTEEIKQLIENSSEIDDESPSGSKRKRASELLKVRRNDREREFHEDDIDYDDEDVHAIDDEIHDEGREEDALTSTEVEISDGPLEVSDGTVIDLKGFEETETVEIHDIPPNVAVEYPQSETGLQYFRVVYADGTQATLPIAPGEQVVIEDEHGNQQIIEPSEQPD
ncbi:zinc finger protein 878 [Galendromus occidentalis]|uniref:Zinc finger protein 878 n=1 Tax=Galendromus occidentalis TaxID=34638 RepID=A0AAJ6QLY6_9ACAR|nr:zinc finger protein 878 [Galendromus occidentalis]